MCWYCAQLYLYVVFAIFHAAPSVGSPAFDEQESGILPPALRVALKALHAAVVQGGCETSIVGGLHGGGGEGADADPNASMMHDVRRMAAAIDLERLRGSLESQVCVATNTRRRQVLPLSILTAMCGASRSCAAAHVCFVARSDRNRVIKRH